MECTRPTQSPDLSYFDSFVYYIIPYVLTVLMPSVRRHQNSLPYLQVTEQVFRCVCRSVKEISMKVQSELLETSVRKHSSCTAEVKPGLSLCSRIRC